MPHTTKKEPKSSKKELKSFSFQYDKEFLDGLGWFEYADEIQGRAMCDACGKAHDSGVYRITLIPYRAQ